MAVDTKLGPPDLDDLEFLELQAAKAELPPEERAKVPGLVDAIWKFVLAFSGKQLFDYQELLGKRIIESVICSDGDEITALFSRQSGKTETLTDVVCALMILLPRLAKIPMYSAMLDRFADGFVVGVFAPVMGQAETLYDRIVSTFTSELAAQIMADPEIAEIAPKSRGNTYRLQKCRSWVTKMSAHARANIESKTYDLIVIDEAQAADEAVITKSISPMGAFTGATMVLTGTPGTYKGYFYNAIQRNKSLELVEGARRNHFEFDWRACAACNPTYAKSVKAEMRRHGADSDYFRMSYGVEWILERGMFISSKRMQFLADYQMERVEVYHREPCLVGIDVAKSNDSTVVTVVKPDWDSPNENGLLTHWVLNWFELQGEFEQQYVQIYNFLRPYWIHGIGVDGNGMGTGWPERMQMMFPDAHVESLQSSHQAQHVRFTHLMNLCQGTGTRGPLLRWPRGPETKNLLVTRRFYHQMTNAIKEYTKQGYLLVHSPEGSTVEHDDYPDSLANACVMSRLLEDSVPEVEVSENFMRGTGRRRR